MSSEIVTLPPEAGHQVRYIFTDLFEFRTLAELPLNNLDCAKVINGVGPWSATLALEDIDIRRSSWAVSSDIYRTAMWVDIDGVLVYGGIVTGFSYQMSTGVVSLSGLDFCGYLAQRVQAGEYEDYTDPEGHHWATAPGAPAPTIAYWLLRQALEKVGSIPIGIVRPSEEPPEDHWITYSSPEAQHQTIASMFSQLGELGYSIGLDYYCEVGWVDGRPMAWIVLAYPRAGVLAPKGPTIELSNALELTYAIDGTQMGNHVFEQCGAEKAKSVKGSWTVAVADEAYPLLELSVSHAALSPSEATEEVLEAYAEGDLAVRAYPLTTPVVTLALFGQPSLAALSGGPDVLFRVPVSAGDQPLNNPLFPAGLNFYFRASRLDIKIPDEGVATVEVTLNTPPGLVPVIPPTIGGSELGRKDEEEALNEEREEAEAIAKEAEEIAEEAEDKAVEEDTKLEAEHVKEEAKRAKAKGKKKEATEVKERAKAVRKKAEEESGGGGFPKLTLIDAWERNEDPLAAGWLALPWDESSGEIVGPVTEENEGPPPRLTHGYWESGNEGGAYWSTASYGPGMAVASPTFQSTIDAAALWICLATDESGYRLLLPNGPLRSSTPYRLSRFDSGVETALAEGTYLEEDFPGEEYPATPVFGLIAKGGIVGFYIWNLGEEDKAELIAQVSDSTYTSGYVAVEGENLGGFEGSWRGVYAGTV